MALWIYPEFSMFLLYLSAAFVLYRISNLVVKVDNNAVEIVVVVGGERVVYLGAVLRLFNVDTVLSVCLYGR